MSDQIKRLADRLFRDREEEEHAATRLGPLRAVNAQLLMATGVGATLEQLLGDAGGSADDVPAGLAWGPLLIAPLAAAANLRHASHPTEKTDAAVRLLTGATIGVGAALFLFDSIATRGRGSWRIAPLAFASAGLLGLLIDRQEEEIARQERALTRRARVVERLVPRRRARLDRVVVHV